MTLTWIIRQNSLDENQLLVNESLMTLGNGYLGVRGNFEEGYNDNFKSIRGTYINAFHELAEINYGEKHFGFPEKQQKIVNIIDAQSIEIFVDQERFNLFEGKIVELNRELNMKEGYSKRTVHWISPNGKEVKIQFTRLVSFVKKELFAIHIKIEPISDINEIKLISKVNGDVTNFVDKDDPRVNSINTKLLEPIHVEVSDDLRIVKAKTIQSNLEVACVTAYDYFGELTSLNVNHSDKEIIDTFTFKGNETIELTKHNVFTDTLRHGVNLVEKAKELQINRQTFEDEMKLQHDYLKSFWNTANIEVDGDDELQEGLTFNLFHLLQSVGKEPFSNISAKGLSGEGYDGHYFWDTEIYIFPFFLMTQPEIAKNLLMNRYSMLDDARNRAKELGHKKGALFPWRTITGPESSAYYPAGTAQYHISADIAYSFIQYYLVTKDEKFKLDYLAEVLFETARLWADVGYMNNGQFMINNVTGPDEYTCIVNNNYYTNVMAKNNLKWAARIFYENKDQLSDLIDRLNLDKSEVDFWQEAADNMYLPYDEKLGIHAQDDSFLQKEMWDFENTPKEKYPLLLHYHPLTLYRYQVLKQADTVLGHFLLEDEADFDTIKRSYDYYEAITTHDSSLSPCVYSIMASKIGYVDKAYDYFMDTARLDLDNIQGNTKDGLHMANMGGTWLAIVFGFAGLRIKENGLHFSPICPMQWKKVSFNLRFRESLIRVTMNQQHVEYEVVKGERLSFYHEGEKIDLEVGKNVKKNLRDKV